MKKLVLFALLLPCIALAQTLEEDLSGKKFSYTGAMCSSEESMREIADLMARSEEKAIMPVLIRYAKAGTCHALIGAELTLLAKVYVVSVSETATVYLAEMLQGRARGYVAVSWTAPTYECVPEKGRCT